MAEQGDDAVLDSVYRLPTLDECWAAYDRIESTDLAARLQVLHLQAWSADALQGTNPPRIWTLYLRSGNAEGIPATEFAAAACR